MPDTASEASKAFPRLGMERFPGDVEKPTLIYAHGFGQTRLAWHKTATRLSSAGYAGISFDARGHGSSRWNAADESYGIEQFLGDLAAVAKLPSQPPILIGASMGGLLGMGVQGASEAPPFSALVLVDITPRWETAGVERILDFMTAHPGGFDSLEHAAEEIAAYLPHRAQRKQPGELHKLLELHIDGRWRWHWDPRMIDGIARGSERYQAMIMQAAQRITVPTLLVSGGRSDIVSAATVEEFLALVPHAEHVHLREATHMVAGDDNDAFTSAILDFLTALPQSRASS
ncbi:MAG: alpha/beta hydrolase [Lysobacteraceae bacterium]